MAWAVHVAHKSPAELSVEPAAHQRFHYDAVTGHITGFDGRVLDVEGGSRAEAAAVIYFDKAPHLSPNQQWDYDAKTGAFTSRMGTGFVLDIKGGKEHIKAGTELIVFRNKGPGINQQFDIDEFGFIRSRGDSAICVDVNGGPKPAVGITKLTAWQCHVTPQTMDLIRKLRRAANQRWAYDAKTGFITAFDGRVLDVAEGKLEKGTKLIAFDRKPDGSNSNQQFDYKDGYFVSRMGSGMVIDISGDKMEKGADLILWTKNTPATPNQLWDIDANGFIRSRANSKFVIDLNGDPKPGKGIGKVSLWEGAEI